MFRHKWMLVLLVFLISVILAVLLLKGNGKEKPLHFDTALASIGMISQTISATGTVEPIDKVEVGTQVSGVVKKIYADYNFTVRKGQLLAELDKTTLKASLDLSIIALKSSEIELAYLKQKFERISKLFEKSMVSQEDIDQTKYDYERAKTNVEKAEAEVQRAKLNLSYATIYSPIDGTVLSRSVDEGQTVAASLNAPTLFTIAQDLLKMEVYAAVDEADIGQVKSGQRVIFTVDAFPGDTFNGSVSQVRLEPVVTSNVVTYTVTILAENPDLKLMPGMTATINVFINEVQNVLTIPSKALKFRPDHDLLSRINSLAQKDPQSSFAKNAGNGDSAMKSIKGSSGRKGKENTADGFFAGAQRRKPFDGQGQMRKGEGMVWVKQNEGIRPVHIKTGLSDAINVQVIKGLKEGEEVVLSVSNLTLNKNAAYQKSESVNPFMPQRRSRSRSR